MHGRRARQLCRARRCGSIDPFSRMVDSKRQVPIPSASAWSIDLGAAGGPAFVVHRCEEVATRDALIDHLVAIGSRTREEAEEIVSAAEEIVSAAEAQSVAVIW